jgi:hypothetical protein
MQSIWKFKLSRELNEGAILAPSFDEALKIIRKKVTRNTGDIDSIRLDGYIEE